MCQSAGKRCRDSLSLLPPCQADSGSLPEQIGSLLGRVGRQVSNYLICLGFLMVTRWIFGAESIFLPALPVLQGKTGWAGDGSASFLLRLISAAACRAQ